MQIFWRFFLEFSVVTDLLTDQACKHDAQLRNQWKGNFSLSLLRILNIYEGLMKLKFSESLHIN